MPYATARARPWATSAVRARAVRALSLALALLAAPACDQLTAALEEKAQEVAEEIAPPEQSAPPAGPVPSDDEQLAHKLRLYIECRDRASRRIRDSWRRYDEHVQADGTPRKKGDKPFLYPIDTELAPCDEAATKGPMTAPPLPEIEKTMATWLEHAKAFASTSQALDPYYEAEGYAGDGWAKGKQLAPGFLAAWQAWSKADDELAAQVEARLDVVERALLSQIEAHKGKDVEWHARNVVLHAKAFVRCFAPPPGSVGDTAEPARGEPGKPAARARDQAPCKRELAALEQAEADLRSHYEANRTQADAVFWMSAFEASVTDFLAEAKAVSGGKPGKGGPTPEQLKKLLDEHHDLVSDANNLRFER